MFRNIKKIEGGPFGTIKTISKKKSHSAERINVKNTQIAKMGILSCFQGSGRRFYNVLNVGREVLRFAVCFGQTEQMNKKVDLTRVKRNYPL